MPALIIFAALLANHAPTVLADDSFKRYGQEYLARLKQFGRRHNWLKR